MTITTQTLLTEAAAVAQDAHAPYSHFRVGAALLTDDGNIIRGCNVENASYGLTVCAERNAVFAAVAAGHREFSAIAIVADGDTPPYPCGACRQVLAEFCDANFPIHVARVADLATAETFALGELLPKAFGM